MPKGKEVLSLLKHLPLWFLGLRLQAHWVLKQFIQEEESDKEMKETVNTLLIVDWWFENRPDHLWFLSLPISQSQTDMLIGMIFLRVYNVGRTDTCTDMAESLRCLPKTVTTLLIDYTPIQNKKFEFKNKQTKKNMLYRKFPAVKVLCFYLQGPGFNPWLGNWDPTSRDVWPK